MHILALDVGTSSVKAAVLDVADALPVGPVAHIHHELRHSTPDAAEVSAAALWTAVTAAARAACRGFPAVAGVGLSVMTPALVLLSYVVGPTPMNLQFWPGAVTMMMVATVTASFITGSGRSAWFVGALLILIYAVFALTLYVVPPTGQGMG